MGCKHCVEIEKSCNKKLIEGQNAFHNNEYEKAVQYMLPLAEEGYVIAQCLVGGLYQVGLGVERNEDKAKEWYEKAGQQGCGLAYNNLASVLLGYGNNLELAQYYYRKAIENGFDMITESWIASLGNSLK